MKLCVNYHNQLDNTLYPGATCGPTTLSMTLGYLDGIYHKNWTCDDDTVFAALSTTNMTEIAIRDAKIAGEDWSSFLQYRKDVNGKATKYNFLNNLMIM